MDNKEFVRSQGRLVFSKKSLEKIKLLCVTWVNGTEVEFIVRNISGEKISIQLFVDRASNYLSEEDFEDDDIEDILLHHLLSEKDGLHVSGYVADKKREKKFPIQIIYMVQNDFGVYKIGLESDYEPPDNSVKPSLN